MLEKVTGIIIKAQDYKETHQLVTIFSQSYGKFTGIARGVNKSHSKMAAVVQPFICGHYLVYLRKGLSIFQQGEVIHSFQKIREDIIKSAYTAYIAELTDKLLEEKQPNKRIYHEFFETMKRIESTESIEVPVMMYELKLYAYGGFAPVVDRCVLCQRKKGLHYFSIREGGVLCTHCCFNDEGAHQVSPQFVKFLYIFLNVSVERIGNISITKNNLDLLRRMLNAYYDTYGGFYLKSRRFLDQIDLLK